MAEVVAIRDGFRIAAPGEPNGDLVNILKEMLAKAEAGELAGAVVILSYADGAASYGRAGYIKTYAAVGALEDAKRSLLNEC